MFVALIGAASQTKGNNGETMATLLYFYVGVTLPPFAAQAAFLILSSTVSPASRAKLISASMLKLLIRPRSKSLRRAQSYLL
jgi:hypothetical protein